MNQSAIFKGNWKQGNKSVSMKVPMISFEEDGSYVVYCPALDISGYGSDEDEAFESFKMSLGEYFSYTINKGTFHKDLRRMGWTVKSKYKKMRPPTLQKILSDNDNFSRIFNDHTFKKFDQDIEIPAA